jgi:hypothetical protein
VKAVEGSGRDLFQCINVYLEGKREPLPNETEQVDLEATLQADIRERVV